MNLDTIIHEMAETIAAIPGLETTPVIEEDLGDVAKKLEFNLGKTHRCVTVGLNGCDHAATQRRGENEDPDALYVEANLIVTVFENPVVNRKDKTMPRLMGMAVRIARELDGAATDDMDEGLHFVRISPIEQLERGLITCDVIFRTKNSI